MAYPRTPGGLFPLTTAPTGNNAGGLYPTTDRLVAAILSLQPTAYWPLDDGSGPLRSLAQNWPATVTGSPTYVAAPSPVGRGIAWGATSYAETSTSFPAVTSAISLMAVISTTASGSQFPIVSRGVSWELRVHSSGQALMNIVQSGGASHAVVLSGVVANTGRWTLVCGSFDGTTARVAAGSAAAATSTTLTGSWNKNPGSTVRISSFQDASTLFNGTSASVAVFVDRVITDAERLWLSSIVQGG